mmetsp:Transcript_35679/g.102511  ORF Transcript_35679/g.102511 Transcript_35679/m.102511 type:complete len:234 (-) Transcript_35679:285-986(-)
MHVETVGSREPRRCGWNVAEAAEETPYIGLRHRVLDDRRAGCRHLPAARLGGDLRLGQRNQTRRVGGDLRLGRRSQRRRVAGRGVGRGHRQYLLVVSCRLGRLRNLRSLVLLVLLLLLLLVLVLAVKEYDGLGEGVDFGGELLDCGAHRLVRLHKLLLVVNPLRHGISNCIEFFADRLEPAAQREVVLAQLLHLVQGLEDQTVQELELRVEVRGRRQVFVELGRALHLEDPLL